MVIALSYDERRTGKGLPCMGRLPGIAGENHWTSVRIKVAGLLHQDGSVQTDSTERIVYPAP
jgi:hypothetical protein